MPDIESLTGNNVGVRVFPDANFNINVIGADGLDVQGTAGNNTLTIRPTVGQFVRTVTGNGGALVSPTAAGNIDFEGQGPITVTSNPGDNRLEISADATGLVRSLSGDSGVAVSPDGVGNINLKGTGGITCTSDAPNNQVIVDGSGIGGGGNLIQQVRTSRRDRLLNGGEYWGSVGPGGQNPNGAFFTPKLSEGVQIFELPITPTNVNSILLIEASCVLVQSDGRIFPCIYILQDAGTEAIATAVVEYVASISAGSVTNCILRYYMTAGTIAETTFYIRMAETRLSSPNFFLSLNGTRVGATNLFAGGSIFSSLTITELTA